MPRGDKSSYTGKQKRQAEHIEEGYEKRGTSKEEAERRAWATVNKETGGGKKSGSGRGKKKSTASASKGGKKGGARSSGGRASTASKGAGGRKSAASRSSGGRKTTASRSRSKAKS
jgi:plasmid stabilization system protein ParE